MSDAIEILDSLASDGVSLWVEGSRIRVRSAKGDLPGDLKEQLAAHKHEVIAAWRDRAASETTSQIATYTQRALWFLYQESPESSAYNVAVALRVLSKIDLAALKRACQALIDRHPSLRTTYAMDEAGLAQQVHGHMQVSFQSHDRAGADLQQLRDELIERSRVPFNLETGPVMRVDLFTRAEDDHVLLISVHHIAIDGWSSILVMDDLRLNYIAETTSGSAPPPRPQKDMSAYALWQAEMLSSAEGQAHEKYWTQTLAGELPVLDLPTDWPRSAVSTVSGASLSIDLDAQVSEQVRALAMACGTTPFVVLLAAYHALLHRYTGSEQTIAGSPTYGRDHVEFADVVGDFVNTIPVKADFSDDPTFRELLAQMRVRVTEGLEHQDYPFGLLVEKLHPTRNLSRTPIFQSLFILQRYQPVAGLKDMFSQQSGEVQVDFGGLVVESFILPQNEGQFDLSLELVEFGGAYQGQVKYNANLFSRTTASTLADHYKSLLSALVESPDAKVSLTPMLSPAEEHQILREWNDTAQDYPQDVCLHELITAQVDRTPNAIALVFEGQRLTYRELDTRANQLAHYLRKRGVSAETPVGVCLERSAEMVIGILGILKAGGAYVPMDPSYPKSRLAYMLEDAGAEILLAQKHLEPILKATKGEVVWLDTDWNQIAREGEDRPEQQVQPENLAYMIYTSGSTGRPKGAMIEHRSVVSHLLWMQEKFRLTPADAMLQKAPFSFDASVWEFFLPLMTGARLVVARPEGQKDPSYLVDVVAAERITVIHFVSAMLKIFLRAEGLERCSSLRDVIAAGEALPLDLVARFHACSNATLHNLYGPTETTVTVTSFTFSRRDDISCVPIGRPVSNTQCYILDRNLQPVPVGVPGELHIGGIQVGRGYHNRPELTAEKFFPDPFSSEPGARLYKSGDLCRFLPDGNIEYLGRIDQQVKVRGFRIELGEIEAALKLHPDVREAVVIVREDTPGDQRLVGYYVLRGGANPSDTELRASLLSSLPEYMAPWTYVPLEHLPLNPSGKLDRNALPAPGFQPAGEAKGHELPRNHVERVIAEVWAEVLQVEKVGIHQHFFELGGHSLSATQMIARLKTAFRTEIPLRSIFTFPTIAEFASHIAYDDLNRTYRYSTEVRSAYKRLIAAQPRGSQSPLYLVAGFMDTEDSLRVLSTIFPHLGLDQPVYALQPRWLDGESEPYSSVQEVAREFVNELRAFQPEGPYFIGGECIGGIVAFEMAQEILRQGEQIGLLLMYDTQRPSPFRALLSDHEITLKTVMRMTNAMREIVSGKRGPRLQSIRDVLHRKLQPASLEPEPDPGANSFYPARKSFQKMLMNHRVEPYTGRITLIVNEQIPKFGRDLGWEGVAAGGLDIVITPGSHWSRYNTHSAEYAERVRESLQRAQAQFIHHDSSPNCPFKTQEKAWGEDAHPLPSTGTQR